MKQLLDMNSWSRKDHFAFFSRFEEPFFGICVDIDCTIAYRRARNKDTSFFLYYLHKSLTAANQTTPFRYRIVDGEVWEYDKINASPTISRPDNTFGFSYMDYYEDYKEFETAARKEIDRVRNSPGLDPATSGENVIHFSSLPWVSFTGLSHARCFSFNDSCPKISFGKIKETGCRMIMPVSVHVHHALMDGFHAAQFINTFQELMDN